MPGDVKLIVTLLPKLQFPNGPGLPALTVRVTLFPLTMSSGPFVGHGMLVGAGSVGKAVMAIARGGFGLTVIANSRNARSLPEDVRFVSVDELVAEEHKLRSKSSGQGLSQDDRNRLRLLEEQLDQCWDLLRQRRARTEAGEDPSEAHVRSRNEVEGYLQ